MHVLYVYKKNNLQQYNRDYNITIIENGNEDR